MEIEIFLCRDLQDLNFFHENSFSIEEIYYARFTVHMLTVHEVQTIEDK